MHSRSMSLNFRNVIVHGALHSAVRHPANKAAVSGKLENKNPQYYLGGKR